MVEMERAAKRRSRQRNNKAKKPPKVPIKTYRWEDIRRARRRGGYPWTHLYKKPFSEVVDPDQFTMASFRRTKSSSPINRVDISEVSSWVDYSGKTTPTLLNELINEPPDYVPPITKPSQSSSVVIEEITDEVKESSDSSDNISQLLDKDEGEAAPKSQPEEAKLPASSNRKRERSVESSRSKYSLSNLSVIKKLQEAKSKIKVPKLTFPTKKKVRKRNSPPKESPKKVPKKSSVDVGRRLKPEKPVYIHIPLKPPPGETDEFSYLEFEPRKDEGEAIKPKVEAESEKSPELEVTDVQKELEVKPLKNAEEMVAEEVKPEQDVQMEVEVKALKEEEKTVTEEAKPEEVVKIEEETKKEDEVKQEDKSPTSTLERGKRVSKKPPLKINPAFKQLLKDVRELGNREEQTVQPQPSDPESAEAANQLNEPESPKKDDVFDTLFKASASSTNTSKPPLPRSVRSKSAEPPNKRRSSLESSYSRKSLSKLAIMKRLKEASDKIKNAFSMDSLKRKLSRKTSKKEEKAEEEIPKKSKPTSVVKSKHLTQPKNVEPVYIHIPLKPPEGQSDEFSYLAETPETAPEPVVVTPKEERTDSLDSTSPPSSASGPVQFIFLTPPSDDEILDKDDADIPETPSSDELVTFTTLKKLAKDAVDQVTPKTLETVSEETVAVESDKTLEPPENIEEPPVQEKMIVDVEDGLNEPPEALKSVLKSSESATGKRVSFKRKGKVQDKVESEYEVIEPPKTEESAPIKAVKIEDTVEIVEQQGPATLKDINVSMSVDEEKTYLDQKIVKDTSLEEDYNKWSKAPPEDHEYEPISPPEEMTVNVAVVDEGNDPKVIISAVDILDEPVEEKKKSFFQVQFDKLKEKRERRKSQDSETHSKSSRQDVDVPPETPGKPEGPSKLQKQKEAAKTALKHGAEQIKTKSKVLSDKLHNIHLPKAPEFKKPNFKGFKLPKIPDSATIHVPNISLPGARKITETKTVETRQYSTESNADDSERQSKRKRKFDLSFGGTFPRFRKKSQPKEEVVFATVPRAKQPQKSSVLSSEGSSNPTELEEEQMEIERLRAQYGDDDFDRRFSDPVEDFERENQAINREDYLSRWQHGNFKDRPDGGVSEEERIIGELVEQRFGKLPPSYVNQPETLEDRLRRDEARPPYMEVEEEEFDIRMLEKSQMVTDLDNLEEDQGASSEGSGSPRRRGRLGQLDINSDEFFVVHEIREGFQTPANALAQMNEYDPIGSNRSLPMQIREPPVKAERKSIKKPKRKKTPHVSQEEIPGDEDESLEEATSPSRPKRRSKRLRKRLEGDEIVIPYQQTIQLESELPRGQRFDFPRESLGILGDDEGDDLDRYGSRPRQFQKEEHPSAPPRRHRSLKSLTQSENESILMEEPGQVPRRPSRRSNSNASSLSKLSAVPSSPQGVQPCVEEPCVQDIRDYMGYAIVDKSKQREPPLPPPRTPPPRKKRDVEKFSTVPRNLGLNKSEKAPVRPLRNYSTLSHVQGSKPEVQSPYENDNKENEAIRPQEEEVSKDLVSGEVVQKMRQRPLPAPPRPPRKPKTTRRSLQDITSKSNIPGDRAASNGKEENVSTQTEPLPPDFVCEEIRQEPSDTVIAPRTTPSDVVVQRFELYDPRVRRELITPTQYSFEETVTHGTLVVKPLDGSKVLPDHQLSRERIVPVFKETSDEEPSEVPESFKSLRDPPGEAQPKVVKAELIQAGDLDVERLRVNQLLASKVIVSEIDASSIATNQITGKGGPVVLNDVELPPHILEQLLVTQLQQDQQKKTPTEPDSPVVGPTEVSSEPPLPPPRGCTLEERQAQQSPSQGRTSEMLEPEVDDQPPPRPPQPSEGNFYLPSQPPASFYALRARHYVDDNIPTAPRRKRHHRSRPVSRSRSTSDEDVSSSGPRRSPRPPQRLSDPSIPELSGRLIQACGSRANNALKRLIYHLTENVLRNADGSQDLHVFMIILLVLIAGLILLGYGEDRTVVHLHHWEYFNPPKDL